MNGLYSSPIKPGSAVGAARGSRAAIRTGVGLEHQVAPKLSKEERRAAALQNVSQKAYTVWMADMIMIPAALVGIGLAKMGFGRTGAAAKFMKSPIRALSRTTFNDVHAFRANTIQSAADVSQITGGTAKPWAVKLTRASSKALEQDKGIAGRAGGILAPLRRKVGKVLDSDGLKPMQKPLDKLTRWRVGVNEKKVGHAFENVTAQLASGKSTHAPLEAVGSLLEKAKGLSGQARIDALNHASQHVGGMVRGTDIVGKEAKAIFKVSSAFQDAAKAASATHAHELASKQGVRGLMKNLGKMGGRMSLFQGIVLVGATAGVAAVWATMKSENTKAKQAVKDIAADIGDANNPMLKSIAKLTEKQKGRRMVAAASSSVAEGANVGFMGVVGGGAVGMGGMMAVQMGLPMIGQMIVPDNAALNAYANLQKAERKEIVLPPEEQLAQVRQLVGAGIDAVPAEPGKVTRPGGGYYNKLSEPVAKQILADKLSLRETMQLVSDHNKLAAYATKVKAAMPPVAPKVKEHESASHSQAAIAETMGEMADEHAQIQRDHAAGRPHVGHNYQHAPAAANDEAHHANDNADKPSLKISTGNAELAGTVEERLALAQQQ